MNLAEKHLSKKAAKGQYGDTYLTKTTKDGPGSGKMWHVNSQEKTLMDIYGKQGEKLVNSIGAGTMNPYTGIEEKWIPAAIAVATFAMNVVEGSGQKNLSRQAGATDSALQDRKLKNLAEQEKNVVKTADAQKRVVELETQKTFEGLTKAVSQKSEESEISAKQTIQKTGGLASASGITEQQIRDQESLQDLYESTSQDTVDQYGKMIGQIEGDLEVKKADLKAQKEQAIAQKALADQQANQKGFFGNLMDMF